MQHQLPHPSPQGGSAVAPRLAAVAAVAVVARPAAVVAPVVVFALTIAAPSPS